MPNLVLAGVLLVATALGAAPGAAEAGGVTISVRAGHLVDGQRGQTLYDRFQGRPTPWTAGSSRKQVAPAPHDPRFRHRPGSPHDPRFRRHPGVKPPASRIIIVPQPVYIAPSRCWVAGYWTYQWVPRASSYTAWVPGHWSPAGTWMQGRWETRVHNSGYYQPYWVEGRYAAC